MTKTINKRQVQKIRWLCLSFLFAIILLAGFPMEVHADSLVSVKNLGTTAATDIAATQDGKLLYVTENFSSPLYIMNTDGSGLTTLGSQTFVYPKYLFADHSNNIFVYDCHPSSFNNVRITKLDRSGNIIWQSNYLDVSAYSVMDMAAFDNYVYLVDTSYKVLRIYSYNSGTNSLGQINGIGGMHPGDEPYWPTGVTVRWNPATSANEIYFTDERSDVTNGRKHGVFKMDAVGNNLTEVNKNLGYISPYQVTVDNAGNVYIVDGGSGINKIDPAGAHSLLLSAPHGASDITASPTGQVFVTCYDTSVTPTQFDITRLAMTPTVTGLSASSGPVTGGTAVTISGTGFTGTTAVSFGGSSATSFTVNSDNSITATSPTRNIGTVDITVTAPGGISAANSNDLFTYTAGPATSLTVSVTGSQTAGTPFSVTVTAKDQYGNTAPDYRGTVHFTTTNGSSPNGTAPSLPANYAFTAGDSGVHIFSGVALYNKTTSTISATDTITGSITGATGNIAMYAGTTNASSSTVVAIKASVAANNVDTTTITITLKDAYNNAANGRIVTLDQGSGSSTISPSWLMSAADGTASFTVKSTKAETVTYSVGVNSAAIGLSKQITYTPGAAEDLLVSAGANQIAGIPSSVTVSAIDHYGNIATGYTGTVHFTSTSVSSPDGTSPLLPSDYTFTATDAGIHVFSGVALYNKAVSTITAMDTTNFDIRGTTSNITVGQGAVLAGNSTAIAGKSSVSADNSDNTTITITLKDAYRNPVNGRTVTLNQGNGGSTISPASAVSAADGTAAFTVKSTKAEEVTFAVEVNGSVIGMSRQITFTPGAAEDLLVSAAAIQTAGTPFSVTVTAIDHYGNIAAGYTGTIHFTSTNGNCPNGNQPSLPDDYTFTATDAGIRTFTGITLYNKAVSTITAEDTTTGAIRGTTSDIMVGAGATASGNSTEAAGKTSVIADNSDNTTITVTIKDAYQNAASGRTITLNQGSGSSTILPVDAVSAADGSAVFTVKSTKAETVTYSVEVSGTAIGLSSQVTFTPGEAEDLVISAAAIQTAGTPFSVTVSAIDHYGNIATGYTGNVHFTTTNGSSPGGMPPSLPDDYTFTVTDAGIRTFTGFTLYDKAVSTITGADTAVGSISGTTSNITVGAALANTGNSSVAAGKTSVTADNSDTATITVTIKDAYQNAANGRTVTLNQGSGSSTISPASAVSDADGTAVFTVKSTKAETVMYTVLASGSAVGLTTQITYTPGVAEDLLVSAAAIQTAGTPFTVTVTAIDQNGNIAKGYSGTVHFTTNNGNSPDGTQPLLPADYTFTATDSGIHTFTGVRLYNKASSTLTAADSVYTTVSGITGNITVNPGSVNASNSTVAAGKTIVTADNTDTTTVTVILKDVYQNLANDRTVTLNQGGGQSNISPASVVSGADGTAAFTVKSTKAETVTYTAVCTTDSVIIVQKSYIGFSSGLTNAGHSTVAAGKSPVAVDHDDSSVITVVLKDIYDNPVSGKVVTLNQGGGHSNISPASITSGADGKALFHISNNTVETVTYTATSTTDSTALTQTATVNYLPGHVVSLSAVPSGGGTVTGGGVYCEGSQVTVTAAAISGYQFEGWVEGTVTVSTSAALTFTMDTADRSLTANFSSTNRSGGGNDTKPISQVTLSNDTKISVPVTVDDNTGNAEINLGNNAGAILGGGGSAITVPPITGARVYTLELPAASISDAQGNGKLTVKTEKGSITISENMLSSLPDTNGKEAGIAIGDGDKSKLPDEIKAALGDRPIVQLTLTLNGTRSSWNNPDSPVTVSVPYKPTATELSDPEHIVVWYIDGGGNVVTVPSGRYDPTTGMVTFSTTHFSDYAVAFVHKTFRDLGGYSWAEKPVEVMASKGIVNGTGASAYSPGKSIIRADYVMMLVNTLGLTAESSSNFKDVNQSAYYYEAVGIAKKLGIVTGTGDNKFNPKEKISRQDMMVMTARALQQFRELKAADNTDALLGRFADRGSIAGYAQKSMAALIKEELITGSGNKINPRASTTRAEAGVFLYRIYNKF